MSLGVYLFDAFEGELHMNPPPSPLDDVWVSLDLETTGLSVNNDEIIEVGAVKFQGQQTIETFQSMVNPNRSLTGFVRRYTGIRQEEVDSAPPFSQVSGQLATFIGTSPIVGHNVAFDLGFLNNKGLRLSNPRSDTWDLAFVLLPGNKEYALAKIAASLGITHPRPHRAVEDARVTMHLFLKLIDIAVGLDVFTLAEIGRLASRSSWVLEYLLKGLGTHKGYSENRQIYTSQMMPNDILDLPHGQIGEKEAPKKLPTNTRVGIMGLDINGLRERLQRVKTLRSNRVVTKVDVDYMASLLSEDGPLAVNMSGFEQRPQQIAMARAVAQAVNEGGRLMVEAGTGVGKSLAYLLPAALYALSNNARVVISTNTINLQEQLLSKDIPSLVDALIGVEEVSAEKLRFAELKGRANYLCLKRWIHMRSGNSLTVDEARLLSKVLVWLHSTNTGDRSELNLGNRGTAKPWDHLSAQGAQDCTGISGVCFLRAARDKAASAHLVVVNHALLMSDLMTGRALIPDHDILVVDEAHHLEEEATRHLGFELAQIRFEDHLQILIGEHGLLNRAVAAFWGSSAADTRRETVHEVSSRITKLVPTVRQGIAKMFKELEGFLDEGVETTASIRRENRITSATRSQPLWSELEIQWENFDVLLAELQNELSALNTSLEGLDEAGLTDYEGLIMETLNVLQGSVEMRQCLTEFITQPKAEDIYWVTRTTRGGDLVLHSAPLNVGNQLDELLFAQKRAVILTSATLSANESFDHVRERTGFRDAEELLLGSPFDFSNAALLCVPQDMPEPTSWAYQAAVEQAVVEATVAAGGRTMALFTSHASLRATASEIRADLEGRGFNVLAQGVDGPPHRLVDRFLENHQSVLLGTSSFWEGVDLAGEALEVLLLTRLPFSVPTEPVFAARSELYEDSFNTYAVPQAVLRIRQGFGRLIRTKTDRGVVVILDRRILSKRYGKAFIQSLPDVTFKALNMHELPDQIHGWLPR